MNRPKHKLVFLDAATYGDVSLERFFESWECTVHQVTRPAETLRRLNGHSIVVTNKVVIDEAVLNSAEARELKLIAVAATGTDIIDVEAAGKFGITVCNVPGYATQSVSQFTMALILELATRAGRYAQSVNRGDWEKSPVFAIVNQAGIELSGKQLGVVGYGDIGRTVAQIARSFGMKVLIAARPGTEELLAAGRVPVEQLLKEADIVSLHCPLTPQTRNLINQETLALMKPTAFLINTARGALIDEGALIHALREKRLAGAALDVVSREPPPPDHPVMLACRELNNLIVTPHTAWSAHEARERLLSKVAENVECFFLGTPKNVVVSTVPGLG